MRTRRSSSIRPVFVTKAVRRPQSLGARRALFQVHLWLGVAFGLYVIVIGISGAVLVFRPELQKATFPQFFHVDRGAAREADATTLIRALNDAYPRGRLLGIDWPTYRRDTVLAYITEGARLRTIFLHPVTAAIIGELPERSWITRLQDLHFDLLGGPTGRLVNGVGALCLVGMLATGLVVWWPGIERWRRSLSIDFRKSWKRITWETHSAVGFWMFSLLMLWAITGVEFAFPRQFRAAINAISPLTRLPAPESNLSRKGTQPVPTPAALVDQARARVPGARVGRVVLPATDRSSTLVLMAKRLHGDYDTSDEVLVYFDQYTGDVIGTREQADIRRTLGDTLMATLGPVHVGAFGGAGVKTLWAALALSFPLLVVTGIVMWWNRVVADRWTASRDRSIQ